MLQCSIRKRCKVYFSKYYPVVFLSIGILYICSLSGNWKPEWDSAYYLMIAKSLIAGDGFSYLGYPCLKIPFGFPVLIAPVLWLCKYSFFWLNVYMLVFAFCAFTAVFLYCYRQFSLLYAALVTILTGWSCLVLTYSSYIMIDIPYLASSFLALYFMRLYTQRPGLRYGLLTTVFVLISFFLRTIGIALAAGMVLFLFLKHREMLKSIQLVFLAILFLIPSVWWVAHNNSVEIDTGDPVWQLVEFVTSKEEAKRYRFDDPMIQVNGPVDIIKRGVINAGYYAGVMFSLVSAINVDLKKENLLNHPLWLFVLIGLVATLVLAGFIQSIVKKKTVLDMYVLFYLCVLLTWSAREPRYLIPVLPALIHYFLTGLNVLETFIGYLLPKTKIILTKVTLWSTIVILAWYFAAHGIQNVKILKRQHAKDYYSDKMQDFFSSAAWLKNNTVYDSRVVSVLAPVASLFSERSCFSFPRVDDLYFLLSYFCKINSDYVLVNSSYDREELYLKKMISNYKNIFTRKYATGGGNCVSNQQGSASK